MLRRSRTASRVLATALFVTAFFGVSNTVDAQIVDTTIPRELPAPMPVRDAVARLGTTKAAEIAGRRRSSLAQWTQLAKDPTAWVGVSGDVYFVDPKPRETTGSLVALPGPFPYDQTFKLHSRPSATRKLFMDFDGYTAHDTEWAPGQDLVAAAYDIDNPPNPAFSSAEMDIIQRAWQIVAEDYAPFNIDVTTEDPGLSGIDRTDASDLSFGTDAVVTSDKQPLYQVVCSNCGGVAYIGAFDETSPWHQRLQPAWIFGEDVKSIAEAVTHEVGHNLGLTHDGLVAHNSDPKFEYYEGHVPWAPIMGAGYYHPVVQWSKGEYLYSSNAQDDVAVIQSHTLPLMADDYGDLAAPSTLPASPVSLTGLITTSTDVDAFQFTTAGGSVTFTAVPSSFGANLDAKLAIVDAGGTAVASADPPVVEVDPQTATGLDATITTTLAAGTYRLVVDGVGFGTPLVNPPTGYTDYASIGPYTLTGTYPPAATNMKPTATASAAPTSGTVPLTVAYSSAGSTDADGTIVGYKWSFSDGTTSTLANPTKTWTTPGTYTATLIVTDDKGADSDPASVTVTVTAVNGTPVAVASAAPTSGTAPLTVAYSSAGSTDPDGTIVGYKWSFSDGTTSTLANPTKTWTTPGTYTATLTVTDNSGKDSAPASVTVTVTPAAQNHLKVRSMTMTAFTRSQSKFARTTITVISSAGRPVGGVTVTVAYSGVVSGRVVGTTDASGKVTLQSPTTTAPHGRITCTLQGLTAPGYVYVPSRTLAVSLQY